MDNKGSDLHLSPGYPAMMRAHGDLVPVPGQPVLSANDVRNIVFEILDEREQRQVDDEQDLDFAYAYEDKARFRGNVMGKLTGLGAVFRTIPTEILTLEQLNLPDAVRELSQRRMGLILVTGPTGSGKSTTMAAMIDFINKTRQAHILTIEDPVEFVHQPQASQITHREVGRDVPSFHDAIRSAGRENVDVVLVGELRGAETMGLALQMANSGVLVFATIHTNSAAATIDRFVNAFPIERQNAVRSMLGECLTGVISQQLLKRSDGGGRVAVQEILLCNTAVASAIRESKTAMISSMIQSGKAEGMQTMDGRLEELIREGLVDPLAALDKSLDKESFKKIPQVAQALAQAGDSIPPI